MKNSKLKLAILFGIIFPIITYSQGGTTSSEGCEDCVGGSSVNSSNCVSAATTWFLGGNQIIPPTYVPPGATNPFPPQTDIGTCNDFAFILKANNRKSVYILPNSNVGIGFLNSAPIAALDIKDGNSASPSNFRIYADANGNVESTTDINMHVASGKVFAIQEGPVNNAINRLFMQNGKVGINNTSPICNLDINDPNLAEIRVNSLSNSNANLWVANNTEAYNFGVDASGIGHIAANYNSPTNLINFRYNVTTSKPQVWIGKKPTTGQHTDFSLAVDGKVIANSVYVTLQGNWADHVFDENYTLPSLSELETFYKTYHHLPELPSAQELKSKGMNVEEINTLLMKKIEELTLYVVQQNKTIEAIKKCQE